MAAIHFAPLLTPVITPLAPAATPGSPIFPALPAVLPVAAEANRGTGVEALAATTPAANLTESTSMRPDQLALARPMPWPGFDAPALAAAWRGMVRTYGAQLAAQQQHASGQHIPGALLMAGHFAGAQAPAAVATPPLQLPPEAWRFISPGPGQPFAFRVLKGGPDQPPGRRRRGKAALRVELTLADGSRASLQLEALAEGVMLELATPFTSSHELLRAALPELKEAIAGAGLKLTRVTLRHALAPPRALQEAGAALALPEPLFNAMAAMALVLARPAG